MIAVRDLRKSYGATEVLRGIDFEVQPGEVLGGLEATRPTLETVFLELTGDTNS